MYKLCSIILIALALSHAMTASTASEAAHLRTSRALGKHKSKSKSKSKDKDCYKCHGKDPCEKDNSGYYKHCSEEKFIQCSNGICYEQNCAEGTVWDQDILTCDFPKMNSNSPCGECDENPCTKEIIKAKKFYHPHCKTSKKYLQCGAEVGMCFEMKCGSGTEWDQDAQTCIMKKKH